MARIEKSQVRDRIQVESITFPYALNPYQTYESISSPLSVDKIAVLGPIALWLKPVSDKKTLNLSLTREVWAPSG